MERQQILLILGSVALVALLYFGFDTKPPKQRLIEKSRAGDVELQETINAVRQAKARLPEDLRKQFQGLENVIEGSDKDTVRLNALKQLSALWFDYGAYVPAGYYAEQVAESAQSAESWAIAGSTYGAGMQGPENASLAASAAIRCFENAISLDPENIDYRINLAICYAEQPPASDPMRGIQSLLELNRTHPENTSVLFHLARFGMRTGQFDRAKERLETALTIAPEEQRLHCLMVELLEEIGQSGVEMHREKCEKKG
jgi:tetratricopeptide (TPR) repeat protein